MSNSHQVTIDTSGPATPGRYDSDKPMLMRDMSIAMLGARKQTAQVNVMPNVGVGSGHNSPMLEPRMAGGVRPNTSSDPRDMVVEVGGVSMSLAMARQLGLVTEDASGHREFVPEVVAGKVEEGRQAAEAHDAEAMRVADEATASWLEQADAACVAAGMSAGLDDLVMAAMHAQSPQDVVDLIAGISPEPEQTAVELANVISGWTEGLAEAMGLDVEDVDELLDQAVEIHGLGAVVGRALAGAHRRSYAPILAMLKHRLA